MSININEIVPLCEDFGVKLDAICKERLEAYAELLLSYNEKVNLTAITEPREVLYKHFYDCLLFFKNIKVKENASLIDVGTGAGFPGLVLKIARPDIKLTLLDGLDKRLKFLQAVLKETGLDADTVHARAEDAARDNLYREKFDIVTARAVARLNILSELCVPFLKTGGVFVALKGDGGSDEANEAGSALKLLGCKKPSVFCENLPTGDKRSFIISEKISQTPTKYPRNFGKIKKSPL